MPRKKGLEEAEIQKLHTTAPEHLTDDELLLSTFCVEDLATVRKRKDMLAQEVAKNASLVDQ